MTDRVPAAPRRVQLSTPGSQREDDAEGRRESKADHVFLDLEDAVAPERRSATPARRSCRR